MSDHAAEHDVITEPGLYHMPAEEYHADPVPDGSLSSSGARLLIEPNCPALFEWRRTHPRPDRKVFDLGHAAHAVVLGDGIEIVPVAGDGANPDEWRTKTTKAKVAEVRARGAVPIRPKEWDQVSAMAERLREHPAASRLLCEGQGHVEPSIFWQDGGQGGNSVWRRARLDRLPSVPTGGRYIIPDYKTAQSADPAAFGRDAARYGYAEQHAWYEDAVRSLVGDSIEVAFVFVVQEKDPPYLVSVCELDPLDIKTARARNRRAIEVYQWCKQTGVWPGYNRGEVAQVSLPRWYQMREDEES